VGISVAAFVERMNNYSTLKAGSADPHSFGRNDSEGCDVAAKIKLDIPPEVYRGAEALLKNRLVMPLPEFEERVMALLREHIPADKLSAFMGANGKRVGRTRGLNLTDWVKAWFTRQGKTKYLERRYIVWLPSEGYYTESLVSLKSAVAVLGAAYREMGRGDDERFRDEPAGVTVVGE
jgi:hypothetical protein